MLTGEVALGGQLREFASNLESTVVLARESSTGDGGDKGSQGWDEGENPHGVWLGRKECGG
jgi:hypothetical protein